MRIYKCYRPRTAHTAVCVRQTDSLRACSYTSYTNALHTYTRIHSPMMADIVSFYPSSGTELNFGCSGQSVHILNTIYSVLRSTVIWLEPITARIFIYLQVAWLKGSSVASIKRSKSCSRGSNQVNTDILCVIRFKIDRWRVKDCRGKREEREEKGEWVERKRKAQSCFCIISRIRVSIHTENALRYSVLLSLGNYVVSGVTSLSRVNDLVFQFASGDVSSNLLSLIQ